MTLATFFATATAEGSQETIEPFNQWLMVDDKRKSLRDTSAERIIARSITMGNVGKILAALPQSLLELKSSSPLRNDWGNGKDARNLCCVVCYTRQIFVSLAMLHQANFRLTCRRRNKIAKRVVGNVA